MASVWHLCNNSSPLFNKCRISFPLLSFYQCLQALTVITQTLAAVLLPFTFSNTSIVHMVGKISGCPVFFPTVMRTVIHRIVTLIEWRLSKRHLWNVVDVQNFDLIVIPCLVSSHLSAFHVRPSGCSNKWKFLGKIYSLGTRKEAWKYFIFHLVPSLLLT